MSCPESQSSLHAYLDGELSPTESLAFEQHLLACPHCQSTHKHALQLRQALQHPALYHRAPAALADAIDRALPAPAPPAPRPWRILSLASVLTSALAACLLVAFLLQSRPSSDNLLAQQVVASHVRSMMLPDHLLDVPSSSSHTVKPWFDGKLSFAPPVHDFAPQGFPLVGGRLDYLADRPVAALIYKRDQHIINLFIYSAGTDPDSPNRLLTLQGFNLVSWHHQGMTFWAVSDLELPQLQRFAQLQQSESP